MEDLKRDCSAVRIPGIKRLQYVHIEEVSAITQTGVDAVSVTLKATGRWGVIEGKGSSASSSFDNSWKNEVRTTLPGWTLEQAVSMGRLTAGRYLVAFTDRGGDTWLAGYGVPLHLDITKTSPSTPLEYQGLELVFSCESTYGFMRLV